MVNLENLIKFHSESVFEFEDTNCFKEIGREETENPPHI